jgi:hypothetical protein
VGRVRDKINGRTGDNRGYILMLALIIMLTLTVIAVGFVTNVVLETSIVKNYRSSRDKLNAAEAGLEVAMKITHEEIIGQLEPFSGTERVAYPGDNVTTYGYPFQVLFDDYNGEKVKYRVIPENPDPQKNRFLYRTYESCQEIIHYAYPYNIEVLTEPISGEGGAEYLKRQIRVLETPLVQYFIFFDDDLPWHPGPEMNSWGRVHTNGNLWFSPNTGPIYIKNFTRSNEKVQHFVTASGVIYQDRVLGPSGIVSRGGRIYVRVFHLDTLTDNKGDHETDASKDYVEINTDINSANAQTQQDRFTDANDCSYVMVGVPKSPAISFNSLFREGFYEKKARGPERSEYFGLAIVIEGGGAGPNWPPRNITTDVTGTIHIYAATKDFAYDSNAYPDGLKVEDVTRQVYDAGFTYGGVKGCIVYSPETVRNPLVDPGNPPTIPAETLQFPANDTTAAYPVYLEKNDQRQDMHGVATTAIDLDRLEKWFYEDYLDFQYDSNAGNQNIAAFRTDPATGNATKLVIYVSRTPTVAEVPGWAGYTESGGPPFPYYDTPGSQILQAIRLYGAELICPTTLASDNPVYVVGDFNIGGGTYPRTGCAIIGDLVNLLSSDWKVDNSGRTGGRPNPNPNNTLSMNAADVQTIFNAAFFSGRDDLARFSVRGGTYNNETEGIHNFLEFHEDWKNATTCQINGSLINLWFTRQARGLFECCGTGATNVYSPAKRDFGWDPGYMDSQYWPPYCPSAYAVERVGWFEGTDYDDEFIQDPTEE